jgi:hypothetical protein
MTEELNIQEAMNRLVQIDKVNADKKGQRKKNYRKCRKR